MTGDFIPGENALLGGRYRLLRRLGSGGMAAVWAARDERLERDVAVKVLSDLLAGETGYRQRFEREARVAASLNHPALVGVLDFGAEAERPYLVMELVRGETLAQRIAGGRALDLDLRALAGELLGALAHIHAGGIVHRDVKPANVLLGPDDRARLTDFGIAQPADATALTQTGHVIGTASYMAPEVRRGEPASARSDLYSLGIVLREAGGEAHAVLAPLIARLTGSEPGERPASAEEAAAMLTDTAATLPRPATGATEPLGRTQPTAVLGGGRRDPAPAARSSLRRAAALAVLGALAVAALALALTGGGDDGDRTDAPQSGARKESRGSSPQEVEPDPAAPPKESQEAPAEPQEDCTAIEEEKKALEDQRKAAQEGARGGKEAKEAREAIKAQFEARKQELEQRAQGCGDG